MATTKISANVLASGAALTNINAGSTIDFTKNVSMSGNLTVDTNTFFIDSVNNRVGVGTVLPSAQAHIIPSLASVKGLIIQSAASQSANLQEWQASNGTNLAYMSTAGNLIGMGFIGGANGAGSGRINASGVGIVSYGLLKATSDGVFLLRNNADSADAALSVSNLSASGTVTGTNLVYTTTDQTIAGSKTFTDDTIINSGLTINSTTKGVYLPRMSSTQRDAIVSPSNGLTIYNTSQTNYNTYNSALTAWETLVDSNSVANIQTITQSQYDAIVPSEDTLYIITDANTLGKLVSQIVNINANYTITVNYDHVVNVTSNTVTVTLPTCVGITGYEYVIKNSGTGNVTISTASGSEYIDGQNSIVINSQYSSITIKSTGSAWIII